MTQGMLAQAANCDPETISQVERGYRPHWSRRIALRVFYALADRLPMTMEEATEFLRQTGLSQSLARPPHIAGAVAHDVAAEDAGLAVPNDRTSREMRDVHRALSRLLDALGPATTKTVLEAAADSANASRGQQPSQPPRHLTVVEPPKVPFPGAVEQVHRTYEVRPEPAKPAKPKARRKKRTG